MVVAGILLIVLPALAVLGWVLWRECKDDFW
jgi:hypothetical protein